MKPKIKVAFASGTDDLNALLIERMRREFPDLPLYVVSEFPPDAKDLLWVRYKGGLAENYARCRSTFRGKSIRLAGVLLVPNVPFRRMRLLALILAPLYFLAVNENLSDFMLRPRSLPAILRHIFWRASNLVRWHLGADGWLGRRSRADMPYLAARLAGFLRPRAKPGTRPRGLVVNSISPTALQQAFDEMPDLFCAVTASHATGLRYVLHGDGANSLYDSSKVGVLGGSDPTHAELCYRAWHRAWPTVAVPGSPRPAPPHSALEQLRFLANTASNGQIFRQRWRQALDPLHTAARTSDDDLATLRQACAIALQGGATEPGEFPEALFLALTDGGCTVFPGRSPSGKPRVLIASAYLPFPLSHGGAVRIHNLTTRAAADWDLILVSFVENDAPPPTELLELFVEVVLVHRAGSHSTRDTGRPEVVEHFASDSFRAALRLAIRKWQPVIAQLEFTQMAQYAADCAPARTLLVEHDITFDLCEQLNKTTDDWDQRREAKRWRRFESAAWRNMSCVVTMSAKDQAVVTGTRAVVLPNGVDLQRFSAASREPEHHRVLFVGSFSHLPNLMAVSFFLEGSWPRIRETWPDARLHIIAGASHEYFLDYHSRAVQVQLDQPGIEIEGFVSDVRSAYERATVVVAPLVASAGTNLKILEAMACGRPVVSTPAGVNGLDLVPGKDFILASTAREMVEAVGKLFGSTEECHRIARAGRKRVEEIYGWDEIARKQNDLYRELAK